MSFLAAAASCLGIGEHDRSLEVGSKTLAIHMTLDLLPPDCSMQSPGVEVLGSSNPISYSPQD